MYNLLGYKPEDLLETSLFNCHHGIDSESLMTTFKNGKLHFFSSYFNFCILIRFL